MRGHGGGGRGGGEPGGKTHADMTFIQLLRAILPYIWTRNDWFLRLTFLASLLFLAAGSVGDLVVPITLKYAVDSLGGDHPSFPWWPILAFGLASFLSTACDQLRDIFFAYVSANTERLVARETFEHLQSLSLSFHLKRETGSVLRSVSRGSSSFAGLLRIVLFQILPVFVKVIVVCVYLFMRYEWYFGLLTFGIITLYFIFTLTTTSWRDKYRRAMTEADNRYNQVATDALLNFETVKYFNAEQHEENRYDESLREYTKANILSQQTLAMLNNGQSLIITIGTVSSMILAANLVVHGKLSVGSWVMLYQFILTLYQPLGFLGTYYRMIRQSMIDVESMLLLWKEKPDIKDGPDARPLLLYNAAPEIKFDNVSFAYGNGVPILKGVSFTVPPGQKVAVVGASGAGKSTLARLLYRFYDPSGGRITIDGQDVTVLTQKSLRGAIAIVPQDTVLFNDTIGYNIGYGAYANDPKGASKEEIEQAAASAQLDAFIARQPLGAQTKVGERGLRLSGGEKQRVAIARAILKKPAIMLFDEATSSLDTTTEAAIQGAIDSVAQGRTTMTVAHRLSTIMNSDLIIVLDAGKIAEQGKHDDLLKRNGLYASMWRRQQKTIELQSTLSALAEEEHALSETQHAAADAEAVRAAGGIAIAMEIEEPPTGSPEAIAAAKKTISDYEAALAAMGVGPSSTPAAASSSSSASAAPAPAPAAVASPPTSPSPASPRITQWKRLKMERAAAEGLKQPLLGDQDQSDDPHATTKRHGHGGR